MFLRSDKIRVDLGSPASTDMRYTLPSDVYLGDASSQVYEFLIKPRHCIFRSLLAQSIVWHRDSDARQTRRGENGFCEGVPLGTPSPIQKFMPRRTP